MKFKRRAKPTLSTVEMNHGDELSFTLVNGNSVEMKLLDTGVRILHSTLKTPGQYTWRGRVDYNFHCELEINGRPVRIEREIPTSRSFYEPQDFLSGTVDEVIRHRQIPFKSKGGITTIPPEFTSNDGKLLLLLPDPGA